MAIKDKHWKVWTIRNDEVVEYDIFNHWKFVEDLKKIKLDDKDFEEKVRRELAYYFRGKYEHEIEVTDLLMHCKYRKIDIYEQVMLNFDRFIEYLKNNQIG